jgi:hypothetical protein
VPKHKPEVVVIEVTVRNSAGDVITWSLQEGSEIQYRITALLNAQLSQR